MRSLFTKKKTKTSNKNLALHQVLKARHVGALPKAKQWKHLPKLLSKTEKKIASFAILVIALTGIFLLGRTLVGDKTNMATVGGEYTEGLVGTPQLINPLYSSKSDVDSDLTKLIYSGLMKYDTKDGLIKDLAESIEISEDKKSYTFKIRKNAKWHDGNPVRAEDVIFTFSAIQNKEYLSPLSMSFDGIQFEQIDERTIKFTLSEPFSPFPSLLTVGILPSHIWQEINPLNTQLSEFNKKPIGSGPYKFEKLSKDAKSGNIRSYTLKRNANYYNNPPNIEILNFKFYPENTSAIEALKNHNVEGLSYLSLDQIDDFKDDSLVSTYFPNYQQYIAIFFNQNNNKILTDDNVREAIALGIDKQVLVDKIFNGKASVIKSFILQGMLGYTSELNIQVYDIESAKQKLEKSKWILETESTIRKKSDSELKLELVTLDTPELKLMAEEIKNQLSLIGIQINIKEVNQTELQSNILKERNYDILLSGEQYDVPDPYPFWHSSQSKYPGVNLSNYSNRKADELIENARQENDSQKISESYQKLQQMIADDIAAVFLLQPKYSYITSSKIQNIQMDKIILPADRFSRINEWYIKTKKTK